MNLSIIVPVYNVEQYIAECIDSVLAQTYKDWELILVDDGSTDNSGNICDEYTRKDSRIKVIHKENEGLSSSRNTGLDNISGKFVTFVDSDDVIIGKDTLQKLIDNFANDLELDIVQYDVIHKWQSTEEHKRTYPFKTYYNKQDILEGYLCENIHVSCCDKIFRSEIFKDIRFPLGQISEDVAIIPQIVKNTNKLKTTDIGYYGYRYRENSITTSNYDLKKIKSAYHSWYKYLSYAYQYKPLHAHIIRIYVPLAWNYISKVRKIDKFNISEFCNKNLFLDITLRDLITAIPKNTSFSQALKTFIICVLGIRATVFFQKIFTHNI